MKKIIPHDAVLIPEQAACVFSGVIFDVYQWQQKLYDGSETTFEMLRRADTVEVIGIVNNQLLVIEDKQPHSGSRMGFPGGRVDKNDDSSLAAAQREMLEETGYEFKKWRLVSVRQPFTKTEWFIQTWMADDGEKTNEAHPGAGEKITPVFLDFAEVKEMSLHDIGYLGEVRGIFEACNSTQELLSFPECTGQEVDR